MPRRDYCQVVWDEAVAAHAKHLVELALAEDLQYERDWTTAALVPTEAQGAAAFVARTTGVVAGLPILEMIRRIVDPGLELFLHVADGDSVERGTRLAELRGAAASILIAERTMLNFLGRLSGVASLTRQYVMLTAGTKARVYDTRKTTPGWRLLEKYAVRCGGGHNHRLALSAAVMIKDNHLAFGREADADARYDIAQAVTRAREYVRAHGHDLIIEVEVDSLAQLEAVLPAEPDLVLADNMPAEMLRIAVECRDRLRPAIELEASGGVNLDTIAGIAATGVERISVGALTHSARVLDIGLDWL